MEVKMKAFLILSLVLSFNLYAEKKGQNRPKPRPPTTGSEADYVTEKRSDGTTVKYKKKDTYDFEGANIDGTYNKPSGSYISNIKDVKAKSIIRVRENFDAETVESARSLK